MSGAAVNPNVNPNPNSKHKIVNRRLVINKQVVSPDYIASIDIVMNKTKGALTSTYGNLEGQLNKLIQKYQLTDEQDHILRNVVQKLIEIEKARNIPFALTFGRASDDEITISRVCDEGVGLIAIDPYGNILVHFAGYTEGKKIHFYSLNDYDAETVAFDFLHS